MSIHGFVDQNGQIQKYNYYDLDNIPSTISEEEFEQVAIYVDGLKNVMPRYNWYDPNDTYAFVAANGIDPRNGYITVNQDSSLTCTMNNVQTGQVLMKSTDESKVLTPGTYTLSARITYNENDDGTSIQALARIGLSTDNTTISMKTERGGNTNVESGAKVGWIKHTVTISQNDIFIFGIESFNRGGANLPYTIDYIQINEGSEVTSYSSNLYVIKDTSAREAISDLYGQVSPLNEKVDLFSYDLYNYENIEVSATASGWRLNESNGLCSSDSNYKLVKYQVTSGSRIKVISDDRFQFQTQASVPTSGASNRVGDTYGSGTYILDVPATVTYLIISTPIVSSADAYLAFSLVPALVDIMNAVQVDFTIGTASSSKKFPYLFFKGVTYRITNNTSAGQTLWLYNKVASNDKQLSTNMAAGATITFTPDSDDYYAFGGWYNGVGTDSLSIDGLGTLNFGIKSNKAIPIILNNGTVNIDVNNRTISFARGMYLFTSGGRIELDASDVYSQVSSYASYDSDTRTVIVTLPYENVLAYNFGTNTLKVCNYREILPDDVILFAEYYQNDFGVLWDKYWRDILIDSYKKGIVSADSIFNAEPYSGTYDWQTPVVSYGALFKGTENVESFAFFTDPHVAGFADDNRNETKMATYCKRVQKVINASPCSFAVCGGDWLNNSTTMDEACYRLGYIKGVSKHLLDGCYLVNGNHDTNYQGKLDSSSENWTGRLTDSTIAAIMFRETNTKKAYYSFDGSVAKCYVLDTGVEHSTMLSYDWEQVAWLAGKLADDDPEHSIIFLHIITSSGSVQTNTTNFATLVQAYNAHTTVTLNGIAYNFSSCAGHVDFWVGGHTHEDSTGTLGGIPYFITASNAYTSDVPLVDLVLVDYDAGVVKTIRSGGTGSNRTISLT